jgi:hypothetical protein
VSFAKQTTCTRIGRPIFICLICPSHRVDVIHCKSSSCHVCGHGSGSDFGFFITAIYIILSALSAYMELKLIFGTMSGFYKANYLHAWEGVVGVQRHQVRLSKRWRQGFLTRHGADHSHSEFRIVSELFLVLNGTGVHGRYHMH